MRLDAQLDERGKAVERGRRSSPRGASETVETQNSRLTEKARAIEERDRKIEEREFHLHERRLKIEEVSAQLVERLRGIEGLAVQLAIRDQKIHSLWTQLEEIHGSMAWKGSARCGAPGSR